MPLTIPEAYTQDFDEGIIAAVPPVGMPPIRLPQYGVSQDIALTTPIANPSEHDPRSIDSLLSLRFNPAAFQYHVETLQMKFFATDGSLMEPNKTYFDFISVTDLVYEALADRIVKVNSELLADFPVLRLISSGAKWYLSTVNELKRMHPNSVHYLKNIALLADLSYILRQDPRETLQSALQLPLIEANDHLGLAYSSGYSSHPR